MSGFVGVRPEEIIRDWLKENLLIREYEHYASGENRGLTYIYA